MLALLAVAVAGCAGGGGGGSSPLAAPVATATPSPAPPTSAVPPLVTEESWYPAAEAIARAWQADAAFILATGSNMAPNGSALEADGQSWQWTYSFVSLAAGRYVNVGMKDGKAIAQSDHDLWDNETPNNAMINQYTGLYGLDACQVDSRAAAQAAVARYKALTGKDPEGIVSYALLNNKNGKTNVRSMYWKMTFGKGSNTTSIKVDALTGNVIT